MATTRLEALPDELLFHLIEKYIDGIDILRAFYRQLNQRFDRLIIQSQRLSFNFRRCRKIDFCRCLELFPAFTDKVDCLVLSDENTPRQMQLFFSQFPVLNSFRRLRSLSLYFHYGNSDQINLTAFLHSLTWTQLETLSIVFHRESEHPELQSTISTILRTKSLKRLYLNPCRLTILERTSFNRTSMLQSLSIPNTQIQPRSLENISRNFIELQYLNVDLYTEADSILSLTMTPMLHLHTLDLSLKSVHDFNFTLLQNLFRATPALKHLSVELILFVSDALQWQHLIQTSLSRLQDLTLWIDDLRVPTLDLYELLDSYQNDFWLQQNNFCFIVIKRGLNNYRLGYGLGADFGLNRYKKPVEQLFIAPKRMEQKSSNQIKKFNYLNLLALKSIETSEYRLVDIDTLFVSMRIPKHIRNLLSFIDCSKITRFIVDKAKIKPADLNILFQRLDHIRSLRITHLLLPLIKRPVPSVIFLDISHRRHSFNNAVRSNIGRLFPALEHLKMRTTDLELIPTIQTVLSHLICLEFLNMHDFKEMFLLDMMLRLLKIVPVGTAISFSIAPKSIRLWIDDDILQDPFWKTYPCTNTQDRRLSRLRSMKSTMTSCFTCSR